MVFQPDIAVLGLAEYRSQNFNVQVKLGYRSHSVQLGYTASLIEFSRMFGFDFSILI